eukprot:2537011-Rhodomonas_salina.2
MLRTIAVDSMRICRREPIGVSGICVVSQEKSGGYWIVGLGSARVSQLEGEREGGRGREGERERRPPCAPQE